MTKKSKQTEPLPRLKRLKERRVFTGLMLEMDELFRANLHNDSKVSSRNGSEIKFDARYILEIRHVFQRVIAAHIKGDTSTAQGIAKASGLSRETVRRILDDLVDIGWLDHSGSHFWVSDATAKLPMMPRRSYDRATKLVIAAAKELQSKKKK